jgi:hypothetical protein
MKSWVKRFGAMSSVPAWSLKQQSKAHPLGQKAKYSSLSAVSTLVDKGQGLLERAKTFLRRTQAKPILGQTKPIGDPGTGRPRTSLLLDVQALACDGTDC